MERLALDAQANVTGRAPETAEMLVRAARNRAVRHAVIAALAVQKRALLLAARTAQERVQAARQTATEAVQLTVTAIAIPGAATDVPAAVMAALAAAEAAQDAEADVLDRVRVVVQALHGAHVRTVLVAARITVVLTAAADAAADVPVAADAAALAMVATGAPEDAEEARAADVLLALALAAAAARNAPADAAGIATPSVLALAISSVRPAGRTVQRAAIRPALLYAEHPAALAAIPAAHRRAAEAVQRLVETPVSDARATVDLHAQKTARQTVLEPVPVSAMDKQPELFINERRNTMKTEMRTITKKLDDEIVATLESLSYELEARKSVVAEMLSQNMDISTDAFVKYQAELVQYKAKYETAKSEIQKKFVDCVAGARRWELDYATKVLTIQIEGE